MSFTRHEAIVVTSGLPDAIMLAAAEADRLKLRRTPIVTSDWNGYQSFLIIPDGSYEGWEESDRSASAREEWIRQVDAMWVDWAYVAYGGDNPGRARLINHNGKQHDE